ncbi:hypothetical protein BDY24DRAFT_379025 [Mrakia frigida]|uniref:uncharacterized protein n=1 Tax=Mrakia frigida TaxID=29902 RepID=UPI003FCC125A
MLSIDQVPNLKLIQLSSSGANQLLNTPFWNSIPASHPLILSTASGIHVSTIAEHVIGTSIMLLHQLPRFLLETRNNSHWTKPSQLGFFIREMRGLTMGILGYGHIGREVARLGQALGMTILAATRSGEKAPIGGFLLPGTGDEAGDIPTAWYSTSSPSSLHSFYSSSDVVVNILPSSPATDLFVNETAFRSMKNDALYINVGRGQTNDEDALVRALQAGLEAGSGKGEGEEGELRIAGASIDVTRVEPLAQGNALYTLENVVLTPHVSAFTSKYWELCMEVFRTNLGRVMEKGEGGLNAIRGRGEE